jgi:Holliday junction resolvasome RuvABC DNA-binding subunit
MATTTSISPISFENQLGYDILIFDSFDNSDDDTDTDQTYFATLTQLGRIPARSTGSVNPIHSSSTFVVESATDNKPLSRDIKLVFSKTTSFTVSQADEDAMTATFRFINFFLNSPKDPVSVAFNAVLNSTNGDLSDNVDTFFSGQAAYSQCTFEDYMMAMAYTAQHPTQANPSQPAGTSSLKTVSTLMGSPWPSSLADIFVTSFSCVTKNKTLTLTFEVDISTLPFESIDIASNVLTMLNSTKMVKAQLLFNYAIGLNILGTRLSILLDKLVIPVGNDQSLTLTQPSVSIDINPLFKFVVFTAKGTIPFSIDGKNFDVIASFAVDNDEAAIGVVIQGDNTSLPAPPGIKGLHFDSFGVGMGLFFKPPGFAVGLQGQFHIGEPSGGNVVTLNDENFALVCEYVTDLIKPKYISFYVPKLSINEVVELFTDANPALNIPINFSDLSFHWSDSLMDSVVLPDGTLSAGGYGFSAVAEIFSFGFYGEANLDLNNGLTANVEVSPLNWKNFFKLSGDGKGFSMKYDSQGNPIRNNFIATTQAEKDAVANATAKQLVDPGGPCLIINTLSMPILHLNASVSLLDLVNYAVTADINATGIQFELDYGVILTQKMSCTLADFHNFSGQFGYYIDKSIPLPVIDGVNLGSIPLKADAALHLSIQTSTTDVVIGAGGTFDFEGYHFTIGDFSVDISISKISDLTEAIIDWIIKEAKSVFSVLIDTAEHWAAAAGKGIVQGYDSVGKVMKNVFNKTEQETATILKAAGYDINAVGRALYEGYNAASQELAAAMKAAGYDATAIGGVIKTIWNCSIDDVSWALHEAGFGAEEVGNAIKNAFNASSQDVTNTLKKWGYTADEIACNLKDVFNADSIAVADIMKKAGYAIDDIGRGIKDAWNCATTDVTYALKAVGYSAAEAGACLKDVFNSASQDVAAALKAMGYTAEDVAGAIKSIWNCGINDVTWAMTYVGYTAMDIASGLKSAFNAAVQDVANSFKTFGIIAQDTANAIRTVYNQTIDQAASVLKQAGYATADVATALQNAFDVSVDAVADAMKQAGYAADDVKNAFEQLGGNFKNLADTAWSDTKHYLNPSNW